MRGVCWRRSTPCYSMVLVSYCFCQFKVITLIIIGFSLTEWRPGFAGGSSGFYSRWLRSSAGLVWWPEVVISPAAQPNCSSSSCSPSSLHSTLLSRRAPTLLTHYSITIRKHNYEPWRRSEGNNSYSNKWWRQVSGCLRQQDEGGNVSTRLELINSPEQHFTWATFRICCYV